MTLEDERIIFEGLQMKPLNYFELIVGLIISCADKKNNDRND